MGLRSLWGKEARSSELGVLHTHKGQRPDVPKYPPGSTRKSSSLPGQFVGEEVGEGALLISYLISFEQLRGMN